jgi:hypothetical protein
VFLAVLPPVLPALSGLAYDWLSSVSVLQRVRVAMLLVVGAAFGYAVGYAVGC